MKNVSSVRPILAALFAISLLSIMDAMIKDVRVDLSSPQTVFLRYAVGAATVLPFLPMILRRGLNWQSINVNGIRAVTMLVTALLFFFAIGRLPLAYAVALAFSAPIWMTFMGTFMLKEPPTRIAIVAIASGFIGVLVMVIGPRLDGGLVAPDLVGACAALAASVTYALAMILTRKQSARDTVSTMITLQTLIAFVLAAPFAAMVWEPIPDGRWQQLIMIGTLGTIGHLSLAYAFSTATAARLAPAEYTSLVWAGVLGFFIFNEIPSIWTLVGAAVIAGACALVMLEKPSPETHSDNTPTDPLPKK